MTYEGVTKELREMYGDAGVFALETSCVTTADCELGIDHVVNMILPALEEELLSQEGEA